MATCSGGAITHGLVPPTPGPLVMVETLDLNLGFTIVAGFALGVIPAISGLYYGKWIDKRMPITVRESPGIKIADIEAIVAKDDKELPPFFVSMLPVVLPVLLIAFASFLAIWTTEGPFYSVVEVLGNKNVAMFIGTVIALYLLAKQRRVSIKHLGNAMEGPLGTAGTIILITSAGGRFRSHDSTRGGGGCDLGDFRRERVLSHHSRLARGRGTEGSPGIRHGLHDHHLRDSRGNSEWRRRN